MTNVIVLGGGIVGLWTAEVLNARGHKVTVRTAVPPEATSSSAAACVITPLLPWEPDHPEFLKAWGWYRRTIAHYRNIDSNRAPHEHFLEPMPSYECGFEDGGIRYLEKGFSIKKFAHLPFTHVDIIPLKPSIFVNNHVNDRQELSFCAKFVADFCNTEVFLAWLYTELQRRGVTFQLGAVYSLDEIRAFDADVVFNCMGFNSRHVFSDDSLYYVRGQSMFVDSDNVSAPYFGIAAGHHAVFKHRRGYYLGSYFLEKEQRIRLLPQQIEYQLSIDFTRGPYAELCERLGFEIPSVDLNHIRRVNTGIRPYRLDGPRIEAEPFGKDTGSKSLRLVHNYGHGAHGWTIGYATAEDAVNIAEVKGWLQ